MGEYSIKNKTFVKILVIGIIFFLFEVNIFPNVFSKNNKLIVNESDFAINVNNNRKESVTGFFSFNPDQIDQQQTQGTYASSFYYNRWLAQSFKPSLNKLTKVQIKINKWDDSQITSDVTVGIRSSLTGDDITNASVPHSIIPNYAVWIEFNFPDITVTPNDTYYIVIRTISGDIQNYYVWNGDMFNNYYTDGKAYGSDNAGSTWWQFIETWDFCFITYGGNNIPNTPSDPNPENGSIDIDIDADLSWNCSNPNPLTYDVYFEANDSTPDVLISNNQTSTVYDPGTMDFNTTYYWMIIVWDNYSVSTDGPIWSFTTHVNNQPCSPSDPSPPDGGTNIDVNTSLNWTCNDPDNDSLTYDVYFGTNNNPPLVSSNQSENYYDPPGAMQYNTHYYWQIIAWDPYNASNNSIVWDFTTCDEPNNPPTQPVISEENDTLFVHSVDPNDDDIYYFIDWDDGTTSVWLGPYTSNSFVEISHEWSEPGTYNIKAKAKDIHGAESNWSETYPVVFENHPPNPTEIDGPNHGKPGVEFIYCINISDPDNDSLFVLWDWGDGTGSDWLGPYSSGEQICASQTWNKKGTYKISVTVKDRYEASSTAYLEVTIPRTRIMYNNLFLRFLEKFQLLERLHRILPHSSF